MLERPQERRVDGGVIEGDGPVQHAGQPLDFGPFGNRVGQRGATLGGRLPSRLVVEGARGQLKGLGLEVLERGEVGRRLGDVTRRAPEVRAVVVQPERKRDGRLEVLHREFATRRGVVENQGHGRGSLGRGSNVGGIGRVALARGRGVGIVIEGQAQLVDGIGAAQRERAAGNRKLRASRGRGGTRRVPGAERAHPRSLVRHLRGVHARGLLPGEAGPELRRHERSRGAGGGALS